MVLYATGFRTSRVALDFRHGSPITLDGRAMPRQEIWFLKPSGLRKLIDTHTIKSRSKAVVNAHSGNNSIFEIWLEKAGNFSDRDIFGLRQHGF
jgi:hypothetical protein